MAGERQWLSYLASLDSMPEIYNNNNNNNKFCFIIFPRTSSSSQKILIFPFQYLNNWSEFPQPPTMRYCTLLPCPFKASGKTHYFQTLALIFRWLMFRPATNRSQLLVNFKSITKVSSLSLSLSLSLSVNNQLRLLTHGSFHTSCILYIKLLWVNKIKNLFIKKLKDKSKPGWIWI